ncbi:phosphatase PAP2 family protein [Marilutibacter chinensis]|uniref:Phosphatase PAP2 family protein n=1 Tax=Marilutibacter chinensis TaxID=2912247 RepID=A0ABS9HVH2_9GAMM|nr:phosphatase PAP2 family protein [Lysobacter chinensis]MCF7222372.1 phosphatase PAP2 family protein [Lysobacter chinensis]
MAVGATDARPVAFRIRLLAVLAVVSVNTALYLWINAQPTRPPALLPLTTLDTAIGWHAWTIWPYWLLLCINPFLALGLRDRALLWATFKAYAVAMGLNVAIWLAWPTRIARAALPDDLDGATRAAWDLLHALDEPNTCFPSGHITIPVVVMVAFARQYPASRPWVWLPTLLFPTIVTTGQHYAIDLLAGAATALAGLAWAGLLWRRTGSAPMRTALEPVD